MRKAAIVACAAATVGGVLASPNLASADRGVPPVPPPDAGRFQKVTLNDFPGEPMSLAVLPDRRVLHTARTGQIYINDPRTGLNTLAADMRDAPAGLYQHDEEGVQGIAVDPNFTSNNWVYVYYSPEQNTPVDDPDTEVNEGDAPNEGTLADWARFRGDLRLSRFKMVGNELDFATEQKIIDVPQDRGICCHVGGQIEFDLQGNLYLSTGDDTNPFQSEGYTPIDDRATRNPAFDARRSAGNTNDLRGKILRIRVGANGGYTVPAGNLFAPGVANTRPEIYVMGLRNPFRFSLNRETNELYIADYSPDAPNPDPNRGPAGQGRWLNVKKAGNFGWPYCVTQTIAYRDYEFPPLGSPEGTPGTPGAYFNCISPVNDSRWNANVSFNGVAITFKGKRVLPGVQQPDVWYSYGPSQLWPELNGRNPVPAPGHEGNVVGGNGISPMGGPVYNYRGHRFPSNVKWPKYYDDAVLFYEWSRDYIKEFRLSTAGSLQAIRDVGPVGLVDNPMDMEFGPDGALYVLDYGDGFFSENPDAQLARIDWVRGNRTPTVKVAASVTNGQAPLAVNFSSAGTSDPDGDRLQYEWDFNADGVVDSTAQNPSFTFTRNGVFNATLRVEDSTGRWASAYAQIIVGNTEPVVELTTDPAPGEPFEFGQRVNFTVNVTDDQPVDCDRVTVAYILGHEAHGHPLSSTAGCSGSIVTSDQGHEGEPNIRAVFVAQYTDEPAGDLPPLTGDDQVVLEPTGAAAAR